ncbi:hypothetical protein [Marinimicrobium sp. ARAG 43.8]|uniref:hypothetical protein n=1 Tax=Marinimicrobium sp. ARAG 43.8 TaxID=3418719 RepID=UPI003CF3BF75
MTKPSVTDRLWTPLDKFRQCTEALLSLAEAGDWEAFEAMAKARQGWQQALGEDDFLQAVTEQGEAEYLKDQVAELQALNDRIGVLAEQARDEAAGQLRQHSVQKKAIRAYKP